MVGITAATAVLAALLAQGQPESSLPRSVPATATASGPAYYLAGSDTLSQQWERGLGTASISVLDRVATPAAPSGDEATVTVHFQLGIVDYGFTLRTAGFPRTMPRGLLRPPYDVGGGVLIDRDVYGTTGLGQALTQAHAAFAVWGLGQVTRNGEVLTDQAVLEVMALSAGTHADDDTFVMLRAARPGDTELIVLATQLPPAADPRGFIEVGFDDVRLSVDGREVPSAPFIPADGSAASALAGPAAPLVRNLPQTLGSTPSVSPPSFAGTSRTQTGPATLATGIPASPTVGNDGTQTTPLLQTPAPGNAQTASALVQQIPPTNSQGTGGSPPLETNIAPLNSLPAQPLATTPAPGNQGAPPPLQTGTSLPGGISPLNAQPATPLPGSTPAGAGPAGGR